MFEVNGAYESNQSKQYIRWSTGADFKIIISLKSNAFEGSHSDESDIGGTYISFLEKHFSAKVQSVQIYLVYRYPATSARHFAFANTAVDSVVNATLNLARRSCV